MERRIFVRNGLVFLAAIGLTACQHEYRERPFERRARRRYGPPPHAPAHGYRHRYRGGIDLVFDSALGVYLVSGSQHYFYRDYFYRYRREIWYRSRRYNGSWRETSGRGLPRGLRRRARRWRRERRRPPVHPRWRRRRS